MSEELKDYELSYVSHALAASDGFVARVMRQLSDATALRAELAQVREERDLAEKAIIALVRSAQKNGPIALEMMQARAESAESRLAALRAGVEKVLNVDEEVVHGDPKQSFVRHVGYMPKCPLCAESIAALLATLEKGQEG